MSETEEQDVIDISKILSGEASIRKTAKQFGLRRDDLIKRIRDALVDDEEALKQLELVIMINRIIFDNVPMDTAAKELGMTPVELDKQILKTLIANEDKLQKYLDHKNGTTRVVAKDKNNKKPYNKNNKKNSNNKRSK